MLDSRYPRAHARGPLPIFDSDRQKEVIRSSATASLLLTFKMPRFPLMLVFSYCVRQMNVMQ